MKRLLLERISDDGVQTLGRLFVLDNDDMSEWDCDTLELPWKRNLQNVSCIPPGTYTVKKRTSAKFKNHFHITGVEGRAYILIHAGNYYTEIRGCVMVGMGLKEKNGDGRMDLHDSRTALGKLLKQCPDEFELEIINGFAIKN
ncbi:hypothetical protein JM79_3226 [Gramella sp. Hel_I_59]|uniref:DUF5675 family protein n=1 Tax=Gramella sp. Hel_I_59 TaxID=1249978 RepID=UPI00114E938B|nr:DUF5675 family protein [Gramella sp. Hel_I_59]TQI72269.1 hypothetical protein JM79_3226 [Gramella sp. Hel_I_59]